MSVTIRDVARLAGVSASTVSRVLNGKGAILGGDQKRIFDAMDELRYVPNDFCAQLCQRQPARHRIGDGRRRPGGVFQ